MRVLLVEDDEWLGDATQAGMKKHGYTVDWVKDGQSALQAASGEFFDIIVLDLGLPKKSGYDVLKSLRTKNSTLTNYLRVCVHYNAARLHARNLL